MTVPDHYSSRFGGRTTLVVIQEHQKMVRRNARIRSEEETTKDKIRSVGEVGITAMTEAADVEKWAEGVARGQASARSAADIYDSINRDLIALVHDHGQRLHKI